MLSFKLLPHTADIIISAEASSLEELFKASIFGLVSVLKPENIIINKKDTEYEINLETNNINLLLVDFLSQCLTLMHIKKALISNISINHLDDTNIKAKINLQIVDSFERDVKAVSYHNVEIKLNQNEFYQVEIIIDI